MPATIKDIARVTGLSIATVSKYINGGNVLEVNRLAIERAISDLDFRVNEFARGLKTSRSNTIGVVIPELSGIFCTSIITIIEDILRKSGYGILVCDCRTDRQLENEAIQFLMNKMVDGIINMPVSTDGSHLQLPLQKGIPVVLIDRWIEGLDVDAVLVNNREASTNATSCLLASGHRSIGIICGSEQVFTTRQRLYGYEQAFRNRDLVPDFSLVEYGDYTVQGGYESMKRLLGRKGQMTAVFVTNYEMTLGSIIALNELGVKIPDDLSFIGFDNLQLSQVIKPKLTIIYQPLEQIAEDTARIMLERLGANAHHAPAEKQVIYHSTTLQAGDSVKTI